MAQQGKSANIEILINGKNLLAPAELFDIGIKAEFGDEGVQANLTIEKLTFRGNARTEVLTIIDEGLSGGVGIFEGIPVSIRAFNNELDVIAFDGYLDLTDELIEDEANNAISVTLKKTEGLNNLSDRLNGITFGNLVDKGIITDADYTSIGYVVEKPFNAVEILTNNIVVFLLVKELAEFIQKQTDKTATTSGFTATPPTGSVGASVYAIIKTIGDFIYIGTIVIQIVRLSRQLINTFIPPKRTHKVLNLRTALSKVAQELGYEFVSEETIFDNLFYLPSNLNTDVSNLEGFIGVAKGTDAGIPSASDYGYNCAEMIELAKQVINGNKAVLDGKLYLNSKKSNFFERQASVNLFDALDKKATSNTGDAVRSTLINFSTDISDFYTIDNFKGTNFQVLTGPKIVNNPKMVTLQGAKNINIPVALGNRKNSLNPLESTVKSILDVFSGIINTFGSAFGSDVDFSSTVTSKIGLLKVSENNHSIPKLLYLEGGKIPASNRALFSAKTIENNYYFWDSFVRNADKAQKKQYNNVAVPFGISDFVKIVDNAYLYDSAGSSAKITELSWLFGQDKATVSYFVRQKYTDNLKETFIEP